MTVLTPVKAQDWAGTILQYQLQRYNAKKLAQTQARITSKLSQDVNSTNRIVSSWKNLKGGIDDAVRFLEGTVSRAESIRGKIDGMLSTAFNAQYGDAISSWTYPVQFDVGIRAINRTAIDSRASPNLLGSATQRDFSYKTDLNFGTDQVSRTFLGTDYYIIDSGGLKWTRDRDSNILRQRNATTGALTGQYAALSGGLRLDSISGTAITFTTAPNTTSATAYSGTFYTSGTGILDAWLYEDLTTSAGRTRATTDLHSAKSFIDGQLGRLKGELALARYYSANGQVQVDSLRNLINGKTAAGILKLKEAEDKSNQQAYISDISVNGAQMLRNEYLKLFSVYKVGSLVKALIDVNA